MDNPQSHYQRGISSISTAELDQTQSSSSANGSATTLHCSIGGVFNVKGHPAQASTAGTQQYKHKESMRGLEGIVKRRVQEQQATNTYKGEWWWSFWGFDFEGC
jgi:hypothetical protein